MFCSDVIHVLVVVAEGGLLGLTQQLARIGGEFAHPNTSSNNSSVNHCIQQTPHQLVPFTGSSMVPFVSLPLFSLNSDSICRCNLHFKKFSFQVFSV